MQKFEAILEKHNKKDEKYSWIYVVIPDEIYKSLELPNKKTFYLKGNIDLMNFKYQATFPIGNNTFIIPVKKEYLRKLKKNVGDKVFLSIEVDNSEYVFNPDLMECLSEEKIALESFLALKLSERKYYSKWVDAAKTETTKANRIAKIIFAMQQNLNYAEMLHLK